MAKYNHVGSNIQNVNGKQRGIFIPFSPDEYFGNADLAGADNWTVAAKCLKHGDTTMWDDISFGLKPAWVLMIGFIDGLEATNQPREQLRERGKQLAKEHYKLYIGSKGACHGSNYGLQAATGVEGILKRSQGKILFPISDFEKLQEIYFSRYWGVEKWHDEVVEEIAGKGYIRGADGHKRQFFGRRGKRYGKRAEKWTLGDQKVFREALAEEPQHNTAVATNRALIKLFNGEFNQAKGGGMIVNICHTVHDSIMFCFKRKNLDLVEGILDKAFDNTLVVAGRLVKIPYEWEFGERWGEDYALPKNQQSLIGRCLDKG